MKTAIIKQGGKQYFVKEGDEIVVEKIIGDYKLGDKVSIESVLLTDDGSKTEIGKPFTGSIVEAVILDIGKKDTVYVVKYKAKSRYFKRNGHRQPYFKLKIDSIK